MKEVKVRIENKVVDVWQIPENPEEITYTQRMKFLFAYSDFVDKKKPKNKPEVVKAYIDVLSAFFECNNEDIMHLPFGLYDDFEKSMTGLFLYIFGIISTYEPKKLPEGEDFEFEFDGDTWVLPCAVNASERDVTFAQAIELLEIERKAGIEVSNRPEDVKDIVYSSDMLKLAVLLKKKGEELPSGEMELTQLMWKRAARFEKLDMCKGLDIVFFLSRGLKRSQKKNLYSGFGIHRHRITQISTRLNRMINARLRAS